MSILIKEVLLEDRLVDVLIQDGKFSRIGPDIEYPAQQVLDGKDKAILPSFVNSHTHAAMTLLRGYADDLDLHTWLNNYIWPFEARLTFDDVYLGTKLACLEMIKSGTTFFCDMYWHMPATFKAVSEMGIRASLSSVFIDFNDPKQAKKFRSRTRQFFKEHNGHERILFTLGPHGIYTVSQESLVWLSTFARENDLLVHIHVAETEKEVQDCLQAHGLRPVEYLESIGFLGPNIIACHCIWVSEPEMDLLAEYGVKVVHNPVSNMKLASGVFPYRMMRQRDICIGLGTDGCSSNNNLDMFQEMKFAALLAKSSCMDPTIFPAQEALECATINGAHIFDLDCGSIAPGKQADCILVDLNNPMLIPRHNLVSNLVFSAEGPCVDSTICNGRVLMHERKVQGEEEIIAEVKSWEQRIKKRV